MYPRLYIVNRRRKLKDGTIRIVKQKIHGWVKSRTIRRKNRPAGQAKTIWSKRFGYLDVYSSKEKRNLICPSGYSFGACMCALNKQWYGYKKGLKNKDIKKMEKYARMIQETQEDMGLKTSSFPHLGIYGDVLVFTDHKTGNNKLEIDHSHLKEKQDLEEAKMRVDEDVARMELDMIPEVEIEVDGEKEKIITIADEIPQPKYRIKHENRMHYKKKRDEDWICEKCNEVVLRGKNHICDNKEEEEEGIITMTDDIPFM